MEKKCPRCGALFECRHGQIGECHCESVPLDDARRRFIAARYTDCLCHRCLIDICGSPCPPPAPETLTPESKEA